jgi:SAM-dependent methyltransferase
MLPPGLRDRELIVREPSEMFFLQQCHPMRQRLKRLTHPAWLGTIRRTRPLSDIWGLDRGTPVDRYYIDRFLEGHRGDIRGRVLEVKDGGYTDRYGIGVARRDVLDVDPTNPLATIVADLAAADAIPSNTYDCFILTQTLQFIYDTHGALSHARRILRPEGVLLATVPAIIRVERSFKTIDYWRFTVASCSALFSEAFGREQVTIRSYGNVLTAIAFLTGMAHQELSRRELETYDEYFPVIVAVRAVKQRKS